MNLSNIRSSNKYKYTTIVWGLLILISALVGTKTILRIVYIDVCVHVVKTNLLVYYIFIIGELTEIYQKHNRQTYVL